MSWYHAHRPNCIEDVEGNEAICQKVAGYIEDPATIPNTIMFTGQTGTGKTTFGRIIADALEAEFQEVNCGTDGKVDVFREILDKARVRPIGGGYRVLLLDEVHKLPKACQTLLLKPLEDGIHNTKIILCTTEPETLLPAVRNRPVQYQCELLDETEMRQVIRRIAKLEGVRLTKIVMAAIIQAAEGSSRHALTILESIAGLSTELMLKKISQYQGDVAEEVVTLCRAIMSKKQFPAIVTIAKTLNMSNPEQVRMQILGYSANCIGVPKLSHKAYAIASAFSENWYNSGRHGLMIALYEACNDE